MAHPAPLLSKIYILQLLIPLLMAACGHNTKATNRSPVNIAVNHIEVKNGVYYYNKQPFTGCLFALQNGDKDSLFSGTFLNGKEDGIHKKWFPNGSLLEVRIFDKGMKTGTHQGFWQNAKPRFRYHFAKDIYEGTQYQWYENGSLYSRKNYSKGQESGAQQEWDALGKLIVNYQSVNGRQYGNIGKKNCASMWMDSVYSKPHR